MSSSSDLRALIDGDPTGRFEAEQLDALLARSLEASTMFAATAGHPAALRPAPASPPLPPPRAPSLSGQFLTKGSAILVLPEPAVERAYCAAPPPPLRPPPEVLPSVVVAPEPVVRSIVLPFVAPVVVSAARRPKACGVRAAWSRRRPVLKLVFKLAILALVVACRPWWWNVGDLAPRVTATQR